MAKRELSKREIELITKALALLGDSIPTHSSTLVTRSNIRGLREEIANSFTIWIEDDK